MKKSTQNLQFQVLWAFITRTDRKIGGLFAYLPTGGHKTVELFALPEKRESQLVKKLIIGASTAAAVVAVSLVTAAAANADSGTVVRVVDGDTVVVSINNIDQTIRLLNVNTPETKDPNKPTECLGPEATDYLKEALPAGSKVRLEFDVERHDRYGRTLAGVFNSSNQLVNAEIARRGLGVPMVVGENRKFLPPVEAAHQEAQNSKNGLFAESIECTLPAQLAAAEEALTAVENAAPATTSAAAETSAVAIGAALVTAKAVRDLLSAARDAENTIVWAAYSSSEAASRLSALSTRITTSDNKLIQVKEQQKTLAAAEKKAEEERQAAAARAEAERKAAEEAAAAAKKAADDAAAAEQARAAAAAAEAERVRNLPAPAPYVPPAQQYVAPAPAPAVPANPYAGYNGPRCYAPGGKTWRPC
ncbi:thermonuclease family protein [Paenarthrobacter sp. NCHU4564]|uniref:thermonuclease family protein n=1 Tax=Paenarthrobacter sp. NCHU4564 TaxID=3451353 RepID=UPI003F9A6EC8